MNPTLLRHGVFPLLDAFNRTRIGQVLAFLEASQWRPYDELAELQRRKLRDALAWAGTSPTYREIWKTAPASRRASSVHPELDGLPIIDKEDLRSRLSEVPVPGYRGRVLRRRADELVARQLWLLLNLAIWHEQHWPSARQAVEARA